jgi:cell division protein FtsB
MGKRQWSKVSYLKASKTKTETRILVLQAKLEQERQRVKDLEAEIAAIENGEQLELSA